MQILVSSEMLSRRWSKKQRKSLSVNEKVSIGLPKRNTREYVRGNAYFQIAFHLHSEHFMVSRRPNPLFTGRVEELGKLKQVLCPSLSTAGHAAVPKIYVIHGMGGAGKSEVALKFAFENRLE